MPVIAVFLVGCFFATIAVLIYGLLSTRRSRIAMSGGAVVSVILSGLAYYAFVESESFAWACGYSLAAATFAALVAANFFRSRESIGVRPTVSNLS